MDKLLNNIFFFLLVAFLLLMIVCFYASVTIEDLRTPRVTLASIKEGALEYSYSVSARAEATPDTVILCENDGVVTKCDRQGMTEMKKGDVIITIGETDIVAPADGYLVDLYFELGDSIKAGEKICTYLKAVNMFYVTVTVPKAKGESFEVGDDVKGKAVRDGKATSIKGSIKSKELAANYTDYTFTLAFDNTKGKIEFGDSLDLELTRQGDAHDCVIPKSALFATDKEDLYYVYLAEALEDGRYDIYRYEVTVIEENDIYAAIKRNFSKDKFVVTSTTASLGSRAEAIGE